MAKERTKSLITSAKSLLPNACEVTADEETAQKAFGKSEQDMLRHHERYAVKLKCVEWLKQWF